MSKSPYTQYFFHNHIVSDLNPSGLESNHRDKNVYGRIYGDFRQPATLLRYMRGAFYNAKYRMLSSAEAERVLLNAGKEWIIKPSRCSKSGGGAFTGNSSGGTSVLNGTDRTRGQLQRSYPDG